MGLLDEAIREHMELKRLRGADPGVLARQERDALGPVVASHPERGPDFANVGQETAELDMREVLDGQPEDELEQAPAVPGETPGQERLWFDQQQGPSRDSDFDP